MTFNHTKTRIIHFPIKTGGSIGFYINYMLFIQVHLRLRFPNFPPKTGPNLLESSAQGHREAACSVASAHSRSPDAAVERESHLPSRASSRNGTSTSCVPCWTRRGTLVTVTGDSWTVTDSMKEEFKCRWFQHQALPGAPKAIQRLHVPRKAVDCGTNLHPKSPFETGLPKALKLALCCGKFLLNSLPPSCFWPFFNSTPSGSANFPHLCLGPCLGS